MSALPEEALRRLEQAVRLREGGLLDALKADLNKSRMEGYMTEVGLVLEELRLLQRQLPRWMAPRTVPAPLAQLPAIGRIYPKPYGQVLVLSPWNYPVQLSLIPLAGAIAAGNTVILKPSEQAPATAAVLAAVLCSTAAMASMRYFRLVREEHPKYSTIRYEQLEEGYRPGEFVAYHLTYLPEGFEQVQDRTTEIDHVETYENPEQLIVRLRQKQIDNARLDVDTEHITPEVILLNGRQSAWYLGNDSLKTIYWDDGIYFFSVSGHLSKEELVKVAESVGKK